MRFVKRLFFSLLFLVALFITAAWFTSRPGNSALYPPPSGAANFDVFVVSHGYHAGLVLRRSDVANISAANAGAALIGIAERFSGFGWIEFGWGDENFYTQVPDISALTVALAFKALLLPGNRSVLHVVGLNAEPQIVFYRSQTVRLRLSEEGFARLLRALDTTFARDAGGKLPADLGRGLYGPSLFYRAVGEFSILRVCNHWVGDMLNEAGVPTTPVIDTLPQGLLFGLKWRGGAVAVR